MPRLSSEIPERVFSPPGCGRRVPDRDVSNDWKYLAHPRLFYLQYLAVGAVK